MLQEVVSRLPPSLVRAVGRAQFRSPLVARAVSLATERLTGSGTIRHGVGAGLLFDATGGQPGYLLGTSEPDEQALLAEHLGSGDVFYDIGANVGVFSTIAARLVGTTGRVYAFEPHPESSASAERNAELNEFANVTVLTTAVSDANGKMTLSLSGKSANHRLGEGSGIEVDVVALDHWIRREKARPPTLVMIDVEGAELNVLDGMQETLAQHRPLVCCEVHWLEDRFLDYCREDLKRLGYVARSLHGGALPSKGRWHAVLYPKDRSVFTCRCA